MRVVFSPEARQEFEEAEHYYNRQVPRLGGQFRNEIRAALSRIRMWPLSCTVESDHVYVIAVAHQHREPNYWVERIPATPET